MNNRIAIIGAGAAGMLCAGILREAGLDVTVFESNPKPGRKLAITGKGRCNVTNNCSPRDFMNNVISNPKFLYGSLFSFTPEDTMNLFEGMGVPLKTERGNRVFPVSDKAYDIVDALKKMAGRINYTEPVKKLFVKDGAVQGVLTDKKEYSFDKVVVATGGASYPLTGSTGDGYRFAKIAGHTITPLVPSLVPLTLEGRDYGRMQGLSLRNVTLNVTDTKSGKVIFSELGEMMFTHFGVTGPLVLSASSHMHQMERGRYTLSIDLKPALDEKKLDARLLSDFAKYSNRDFINALSDLLPQKMIPVFADICGVDKTKKVNVITKEERKAIIATLKAMKFTVKGFRPIEEAIVTSGGVDTKEVDPKTMQSKVCSGLYFIGEVLDLDAYTGGFNLQIAFSTANACAQAIIKDTEENYYD